MTKVIIVDKSDNPVGLKSYANIKYRDIYRVSALWLTDKKTGDVLITQRSPAEYNNPGEWMTAVAGTIEEGENYDENIVHEIEEEIGLNGLALTTGPKVFTDDGQHRFFVQWFIAAIDKDKAVINIRKEEVEDYQWIPKQQLISQLAKSPDKFISSLEQHLQALRII